MLNKEQIDTMRLSIVKSFFAEADRLKLSNPTVADMVGAASLSVYHWRAKGRPVTDFTTIMTMAELTPHLAQLQAEQIRSARRKKDGAAMLLGLINQPKG